MSIPVAMGRRLARLMTAAALCVCLAGLLVPGAGAVQPDEILDDPVLESRARQIGKGLRCLVCQNQSIDDSDAPLAADLRKLVRERLEAVGGTLALDEPVDGGLCLRASVPAGATT